MDGQLAAMLRAAGAVTNPEGTERLHAYWVHGEGAQKIRWGQPNDFARCVAELGKYIRDPQGYCAKAHHAALGIWPATHAAMEKHAGRAAMADTKAPYGDVAYADPGYLDADGNQASKSGKPGVKRYPLTADKVTAAWSYINQADNGRQYTAEQLSAIKGKIRSAMEKHGHQVSDDTTSASRSGWRDWEPRPYPLEDIRILTRADGAGTGTVVEAYATVFDQPAEIRDGQGHYMEVIDRSAFDQTLARIQRQPGGVARAVKVLYNHGKTAEGAPAPEFQVPIGVPLEIRPEARGLLTRTEYDPSDPFTERILSKIKAGAITAQSFVGSIIRSDPDLRGPGDKYRGRNGTLPTVRRMALGLREYGPVLWPAYSGAEILGVRMSIPGSAEPDSPEIEEYAAEVEAAVAGSAPEDATSARYHQHALYRLRSEELRERIGLNW